MKFAAALLLFLQNSSCLRLELTAHHVAEGGHEHPIVGTASRTTTQSLASLEYQYYATMYVGSAFAPITMTFDTGTMGCFVPDSSCLVANCPLNKFTSSTSSTYSPGSL